MTEGPILAFQQPEKKTVIRFTIRWVSGENSVVQVEEGDSIEENDNGILITRENGDFEILSKAAIAHMKRQTILVKLKSSANT